jgi:nucleoside-diphosphate-sugar epimerase
METAAKIYVAGHRGMMGSALVRRLQQAGYTNILVRVHDMVFELPDGDLSKPAIDAYLLQPSCRPAKADFLKAGALWR